MIAIIPGSGISSNGRTEPMMEIDGRRGLMQCQLAVMIDVSPMRLSQILVRNALERPTISRSDANELKRLGIIHRHSRGNFLPIETVVAALRELNSKAGENIRVQIGQFAQSAT